MNSIIGTQFKGVRAWLRETNIGHCRIRTGNVYGRRARVEFPKNRRRPTWIDDGTGQRRIQSANRLINTSIDGGSAWRSRPFRRPGCLNHFKIADVDRGKIVERIR